MNTDKNGLLLSNASDSGYKFVTTFVEGPLAGRFIAFADVKGDELQAMNKTYVHGIKGFFEFKNVVPLGVFDDVRDAAYVGQNFYGTCSDDRDANIEELFSGNESVIPKVFVAWDNAPDFTSMNKASNRAKKRRMGKTFNAKTADKLIDSLAGNFRDYRINNWNAKLILAEMEKLFNEGKSLSAAVNIASEPYKV